MASTNKGKEQRRKAREAKAAHAAQVRAQRLSAQAEQTDARTDWRILEWCYEYLPHHFYGDPAEFHQEIERDLEAAFEQDNGRNAYAAPRGHNKSTFMTLGVPLYRAAVHREPYILIISDTTDQAKDHLGNIIKELTENEQLLADYPHLRLPEMGDYKKKSVKRKASDIVTLGGVKLTAKGAGQSLRGARHGNQRPSLIIVDDLENDKLVETEVQRAKLKNWFLKSLSNLPGASGAQIIVVGTILHKKSLLNWLLSPEGPKTYVKRLYRAIKEDGAALWPAAWTLEKLNEKRLEIGSKAFASEYLNEPVDEGSTLWKEAWLNANRRSSAPELRRVAVALDPSASGKGDLCGIVAGGVDVVGEDAHGYVLEDNSVQGSPGTWARIALETYWRLEADYIVAEANQGGEMIVATLRSELRAGEALPPIKLVHASRGKTVRADPIATLDERGKVSIVGKLPLLEDELVSWTPGQDSPNRLDAYVWLLTDLMLGANELQLF